MSFFEYNVILQADNGSDFIQQLKPDDLPEIVLMDIEMPLMNGYEVTVWVQRHYPDIK